MHTSVLLSCHVQVFVSVVNPRRACAARVTVVACRSCLSVCLSVKSHLTYSRPFFLRKALTHAHYSVAPPPSVFPVPAYLPLPPLASFPLPLAAQRNGGKRMCQSGLPAYAASLRETGSIDRYTPPVGPCPIE